MVIMTFLFIFPTTEAREGEAVINEPDEEETEEEQEEGKLYCLLEYNFYKLKFLSYPY